MHTHTLSPAKLSDAMHRTANGDPHAFTDVYHAYADGIYRFVYNKTLHQETAEDITHDVFIKALKQAPSFNPKKAAVSTWLYRIARNTVIDHYRRHKPSTDIADVWDAELGNDGTDLPYELDSRISYDALVELMQTLTPEKREIITLRYWHGKSYAEIAEILGKKEDAVKMQTLRTVKILKNSMPGALALLLFLAP